MAGARRLAGLWILGAAAAAAAEPSQAQSGTDHGFADRRICATLSPDQARIRFHHKRWDLREIDDLDALIAALDKEIETSTAGGEGKTATYSDADRDALAGMKTRAVRAMASEGSTCEALVEIAEISDSLELGAKPPLRRRIDLFEVPFYYYDLMHNPVAVGDGPAANLASNPSASADPSLVDPDPSTFWSRPADIASRDLYEAFGPILRLGSEPCAYDEPKTSYGTTPGFTMKCGDRGIKVKFGFKESSKRDTEVAVTRLYGALGYHVEPSDYAPEIRIRYDRRILLEFNSRKDLSITITAIGFIPVGRIKIQRVEDPFHYIRSAVMKDGTILSAEDLARRLIRRDILERSPRAARKVPRGTHSSHYRDEAIAFERELDALVMVEGNIQLRDTGGRNIGPWDWNRLDHSRRRELRGAALLSAWTNYFDVRWDNNRLKFVDGEDGTALRHFISDLGGSLGRAENFKVDSQGLVNDFPWTFTEGPVVDSKGHEKRPFRIVQYQPYFETETFRAMTVDDARWMARLIAQLTENQLVQALIATGYTSAEVRLYAEKLISRRDKMIEDLGLTGEIPLLRPNGIVRTLDYDPRKDGPLLARGAGGAELRPIESRDLIVRAGRVEPR